MVIRRQIGHRCKRLEHRPRSGIELRQRLEPQDQLHRPDHAHGAVLRAVDDAPLRIGAGDKADSAMGIDMVRAVLGVVFDDEDRRLGPQRPMADSLDEFAEGQVVAGHAGTGTVGSGCGAMGVILTEAHDDEPRHRSLCCELRIFPEHDVDELRIAFLLLAAQPVVGAHVPHQTRHSPLDPCVSFRIIHPPAVFLVAAIADAGTPAGIPEVARGGAGEIPVVVVVDTDALGIGEMPVAGDVVGVIGHRAPGMAVATHLTVAVGVVEKRELLGDLVVIRSDIPGKHAQRGITVSLGRLAGGQIAEHLVVRAILLDHIDHVADRGGIAHPAGDRRLPVVGHRSEEVVGVGAVGIHLAREARELLLVGHVDDRQRSVDDRADVGMREELANILLEVGELAVVLAAVVEGIGSRLIPLPHADKQALAIGGDCHGRRIPAGGDEAANLAAAGAGDVNHRDAIVVGIGNVERLPVGGDSEGIGRAPLGGSRKEARGDRLDDNAPSGIDDPHGVGRRARHEQPVVLRVKDDLVRMLADGHASHDVEGSRIDHHQPSPGPVTHIQQPVSGRDPHVIRPTANVPLEADFPVVIHRHQPPLVDVEGVEPPPRIIPDKSALESPLLSESGCRLGQLGGIHLERIGLALGDEIEIISLKRESVDSPQAPARPPNLRFILRDVQSKPTLMGRLLIKDGTGIEIDKHQAVFVEAVAGDQRPLPVLERTNVEDEIAGLDLPTRGGQMPAVGKQESRLGRAGKLCSRSVGPCRRRRLLGQRRSPAAHHPGDGTGAAEPAGEACHPSAPPCPRMLPRTIPSPTHLGGLHDDCSWWRNLGEVIGLAAGSRIFEPLRRVRNRHTRCLELFFLCTFQRPTKREFSVCAPFSDHEDGPQKPSHSTRFPHLHREAPPRVHQFLIQLEYHFCSRRPVSPAPVDRSPWRQNAWNRPPPRSSCSLGLSRWPPRCFAACWWPKQKRIPAPPGLRSRPRGA